MKDILMYVAVPSPKVREMNGEEFCKMCYRAITAINDRSNQMAQKNGDGIWQTMFDIDDILQHHGFQLEAYNVPFSYQYLQYKFPWTADMLPNVATEVKK